MVRQIVNLKPHKPASAAMYLFHDRYAESGLGSMDFWYSLLLCEQQFCRSLLSSMESARDETQDEKIISYGGGVTNGK